MINNQVHGFRSKLGLGVHGFKFRSIIRDANVK